MSGKNALAFAVGLGGGYMKAERQAKDDERMARADAREEEDFQARQEDRQWQRQQRELDRANQRSLADAAAPRSAIEGSIVTDGQGNQNLYRDPAQAEAARADLQAEAELRGGPSLADVKPGFGVTGTSLGNKITTQRPDVDAMNTPQARGQRVVDTMMGIDPVKAMSLQSATTAAEKARADMEEAKRLRRKEIEQEGMVEAVRAAQSGDPSAVKAAFNKTGQYKIEGDLKVTPVKRKAPWGGEVDSYDYEGTIIGADGKSKPVKINSLDAMVRMIPFKDMFEAQSKLGLEGVKAQNSMREIGARGAEDRRTADHKKSIGGDNISREERMRYTSLFEDAGRRMGEAQRALNTILSTSSRKANTPGTPEYEQAKELRNSIAGYADERKTYQVMLVGSQTVPKTDGAGKTGSGGDPQRVGSKAERDKLPKGTRYVGPDGKTYIKQ